MKTTHAAKLSDFATPRFVPFGHPDRKQIEAWHEAGLIALADVLMGGKIATLTPLGREKLRKESANA